MERREMVLSVPLIRPSVSRQEGSWGDMKLSGTKAHVSEQPCRAQASACRHVWDRLRYIEWAEMILVSRSLGNADQALQCLQLEGEWNRGWQLQLQTYQRKLIEDDTCEEVGSLATLRLSGPFTSSTVFWVILEMTGDYQGGGWHDLANVLIEQVWLPFGKYTTIKGKGKIIQEKWSFPRSGSSEREEAILWMCVWSRAKCRLRLDDWQVLDYSQRVQSLLMGSTLSCFSTICTRHLFRIVCPTDLSPAPGRHTP